MKTYYYHVFHGWYFLKILIRLLNRGERDIGHAKRTRGVINFYKVLVAIPEGKRPQSFVY
jgi:hypothetical protein